MEEPEYSEFMAWYYRLSDREAELIVCQAELDTLLEELGTWVWESMGVVRKVEIYW